MILKNMMKSPAAQLHPMTGMCNLCCHLSVILYSSWLPVPSAVFKYHLFYFKKDTKPTSSNVGNSDKTEMPWGRHNHCILYVRTIVF